MTIRPNERPMANLSQAIGIICFVPIQEPDNGDNIIVVSANIHSQLKLPFYHCILPDPVVEIVKHYMALYC